MYIVNRRCAAARADLRRTYVLCARAVFVRARSQVIHRKDYPGTSKFFHLFQFLTVPIINFRGSVHTLVYTVYCIQYRIFRIFKFSDNSKFSIVYTIYCIQYTVRSIRCGGNGSRATDDEGSCAPSIKGARELQRAALAQGAAKSLRSCEGAAKGSCEGAAFRFKQLQFNFKEAANKKVAEELHKIWLFKSNCDII